MLSYFPTLERPDDFTLVTMARPTSLCFSAEILITDGRLTDIGQEVNATAGRDEELQRTLSDLEKELRDINATVAHKQQVLEDYLTSGFEGNDPRLCN